MKSLEKKVKDEYYKSKALRNIEQLNSANISYEQSMKIRKEQNDSYVKYLFFQKLNKEMEKSK